MPTASASSLTEHGPALSRPRIRTRLGVASACIVSATTAAKRASSSAVPRCCPPCGIEDSISEQPFRSSGTTVNGMEPLEEAVDHVRGPADAGLIVEYGDYECPYSRRA